MFRSFDFAQDGIANNTCKFYRLVIHSVMLSEAEASQYYDFIQKN
ncbi:hypothetical protein [Chryseobacterium taiwanense]|nr:hypothetical protein [Chryseobacterium taiwanense]